MGDMRKTSETRPPTLEFVFTVQLAGEVREILVVKATANGEFFAFPVYSRIPKLLKHVTGRDASPPVDVHASKHFSGEWHLRAKLGGERLAIPHSFAKLQPACQLSGVELLIHMPLLKSQFWDLPVAGSNRGKPILVDAESEGFTDDFLAIRAFLVEPGKELEIPIPKDVTHYVRHIEKGTVPWIAVDLCQ
jgi:hypothetical protein